MSARARLKQSRDAGAALSPAFAGLSDAALLAHFRARTGVRFEAVPSLEETRPDRIDAILDNGFDLVGETHVLADPPHWLANPSADRQWLIACHKFYYAVGLGLRWRETGDRRYLRKWITLTDSWMAQTPLLFVNAQTTGRRIQNWIYAYRLFVLEGAEIPADFHRRFIDSLGRQVEALSGALDPARNHRTLELSAIFLAAVAFPEFEQAGAWRAFALAEIVANMRADLLPDGVQCELSTHYHHTVLKNYLNIRRLAQWNGVETPAEMDRLIRAALRFALHAHKPDGAIPSFSDGDPGDHRALLRLGWELYGDPALLYAATEGAEGAPPAERAAGFEDSGYYMLRSGWGEGAERYRDERFLMFDCGPLGAGDHGHLDLLSIEVAAFGRSLVVDPGRYTYQEDGETNWRAAFRGTAAHNTVLVDGRDQTRYAPGPGGKRRIQGPAPDHALRGFVTGERCDYLHGIARSHEYPAVHERRIFFPGHEYWIVWDLLRSEQEHRYDQLFHLSEAARGAAEVETSGCTLRLRAPHLLLARAAAPGVSLSLEQGFVSRVYGEKRPAPVARFTQQARSAAFHAVLLPWRDQSPGLTVCEWPVLETDGTPAPAEARAISVTIARPGGALTTDFCFIGPEDGRPRRFARTLFAGAWGMMRFDSAGRLSWLHEDERAEAWGASLRRTPRGMT